MLAFDAASVIACVAEVSTGLTMLASTPEAMKLKNKTNNNDTSFLASSIWTLWLFSSAYFWMPLRSTVRKLSSNRAIDTPKLATNAELIDAPRSSAPVSAESASFFMFFSSSTWRPVCACSSTGGPPFRMGPIMKASPHLGGERCLDELHAVANRAGGILERPQLRGERFE